MAGSDADGDPGIVNDRGGNGEEVTALFGHILRPHTLSDFLAQHYDRAPLKIARNDPDWFADILTIGDVERVVTELAPPFPRLRLVAQSEAVPVERYTFSDGAADPGAVFAAFRDGATIILDQLHRTLPRLARLTRALEVVLHAPIQTNIYYTPPGGQGFKAHYDTHDVFVLQVAGEKTWRLYDSPVERPLPSQPFEQTRPEPGAESDHFVLGPGHTLYVPRGLMHEAEAGGEAASLHVTVGVLGRTLGDVLIDAVSDWVHANPAARALLPPRFAEGGAATADACQALDELAGQSLGGLDLKGALERRANAFIQMQRPLNFCPSVREALADRLEAATPLVRRQDLTVRLAPAPDDQVMMLVEGRQILLPDFTRAALDVLLDGRPRSADGLESDLDAEERLVLCRRLVREGVLVAA